MPILEGRVSASLGTLPAAVYSSLSAREVEDESRSPPREILFPGGGSDSTDASPPFVGADPWQGGDKVRGFRRIVRLRRVGRDPLPVHKESGPEN
jgi:hypothetical protein